MNERTHTHTKKGDLGLKQRHTKGTNMHKLSSHTTEASKTVGKLRVESEWTYVSV